MIGGIGILVFLAAWIWAFASLYDVLPNNRAVQLVYFAVAGLGWGVPLMPLMSWMGKADRSCDPLRPFGSPPPEGEDL